MQAMKKNNNQLFSSKSSRNPKSKNRVIEDEEVELKGQGCPYFQGNALRDKIKSRVKTNNTSFANQSSPNNHLEKASNILTDLMTRHRKAKEKLEKMREESQKNYSKVHPFRPHCQNNSQRYAIKGNVIRRNQKWLRQKKRKNLQLKEQTVIQQIKQCTFSPLIKSRKQSQVYLRNRSRSRSMTPKSKQLLKKTEVESLKRTRRDFTQAEYQSAKQSLISKMMNIAY